MNGSTPGASNGVASSSGVTLTVNVNPNISIAGYNSAGNVQSVVSLNTPTTFMGLFGIKSVNVSATAIASNTISSSGCIYVQNGGGYADPAAKLWGSSELSSPQCGTTVNGNIDMGGSANIDAKFVAASGTITTGGSSSITGGPQSQNAPPTPDPLSKLQQSANQPTVNTAAKTCTAPAGSGMNCLYDWNSGNLVGTLDSNTIYVYDNSVNGGAGPKVTGAVTGSNVTIYLMGNIPFDFENNGTLTLNPPGYGSSCVGSSNPLCGILIDAPTDGSGGAGTYTCSSGVGNNRGKPGELYFDFGSSTTKLEGIVYAPYMHMFLQDQGATTTMDTDLVIGNMCMQAATATVNGYSGAQSPLTRVGLVY